MDILAIRNFIYTEFLPMTLSIGQPSVDQQIGSAIRYWNTHSAYKYVTMFPVVSGRSDFMITLNTGIKNVVKCYPSVVEDTLLQTSPMGVLLGFVTLDSMTTDLIMMLNAMEGYRIYLGQDFRFRYERSVDQENVPGQLYIQKCPQGSGYIAVVGLKYILPGEDITDPFIYDWILKYAMALVKVKEGNARRMGQIIGIQNDGEKLSDEGAKEIVDLQKVLAQESQWALLATRK